MLMSLSNTLRYFRIHNKNIYKNYQYVFPMNNTFKNNYSLLSKDILFSIQLVYWHHRELYEIYLQGVKGSEYMCTKSDGGHLGVKDLAF